ncbi:MAG: AHH domain-containing protein [Roseburia sp.]|nr:AHH domain-containing protein [Roseburia sp.]
MLLRTAGGATQECRYDLNGNLVCQRDVTGKETEYTYNMLDLPEKISDNGITMAEYRYYPDGSVQSLRNGDLYTEYAYDADKNLSRLKTMLGTETLADNRYAYDGNGNRTEKRQPGGVTRYVYDALNRLTGAEYPDATEELFYDRAGNRTKRLYNGAEETYVYDPRNRLTRYTKGGVTTEFVYDRAGNLLKDDRAAYTYDAFNRVEKAETFDGHVQINRYDAEGLRHELEEDGRLVRFIFRGDEVVAEESMEDRIRYIRTDTLLASDAENARTYYHYASDEMGSVTHVIEGTEILNHYEYDAWGNLTACEEKVHNRFKFNGQQWDPITQQYYLRARFYNPVIARFTQEDTYRGDGLNLYAYCWNNPVYYVDPSGHWCDKKEQVFRDLMKERGITEADLSADPELRLRLMAEASNIVKEQSRNAPQAPQAEAPDNVQDSNRNSTDRNTTGSNSAKLRTNLEREGRGVEEGQAAAHIVASTGKRGHWAAADDSRKILAQYDIGINDAANGIPLGHPNPHSRTHTRIFHERVYARLFSLKTNMSDSGYGRNAIRSALRNELRNIGRITELHIGELNFYDYL